MKAKERARHKLLKYLGNPENDFLPRIRLSTNVLGYKTEQAIHNLFKAEELDEIEREALDIRRSKYTSAIAKIDKSLLKEAKKSYKAARLVYQRFEDWAPKTRHELTGKDGGPIKMTLTDRLKQLSEDVDDSGQGST